MRAFGGPPILANAAGLKGATGPVHTLTDDWMQAVTPDFLAAFRVSRAFIPAMQAAGRGRVVRF